MRNAFVSLIVVACIQGVLSAAPCSQTVHNVRVAVSDDACQLLVDGKPFVVKGAGGDFSKQTLADCGGNSFRTWGADDLKRQLEEANKYGLKVAVGVWLGHEEQGFHYSDSVAVQKQFDAAIAVVKQFKDDPAVLLWSFGNEMEGYKDGSDPDIWNAVESIAKESKRLDPNHPTMTVIAEVGGHKVQSLHKFCPDIDIVGINSYGGGPSVGDRYKQAGGVKPYILTEYGPPGVWETGKTTWGAAPELSSTQKALKYQETYVKSVVGKPGLCLGSYAFAWGNKQEATATWFGMFLRDGSRLQCVDTVSALWKGVEPNQLCPDITNLSISTGSQLDTNSQATATIKVTPAPNTTTTTEWILQRDDQANGVNGEVEADPPSFPNLLLKKTDTQVTFQTPKRPGHYRLFAYVRDGQGRAATANLPLLIRGVDDTSLGQPAGLPLVVYTSKKKINTYVPSGWMGDVASLKYDGESKDFPRDGQDHSLLVSFNQAQGWGGIAWQLPEGDWGDKPGGLDLTGAKKLTFWARTDKGTVTVKFGMGLIDRNKRYYDTGTASSQFALTSKWQQFSIDVGNLDLSRIKTGFYLTFGGSGRPVKVYLDDIEYD